jgi:ABC-type dipeptide/oligopeptide/nickel transport system permease subunit
MEIHGRDQFQLPGYRYILGTDFLGRDVLSRTLKGFRSSIPRVVGLMIIVGGLGWCCARLAVGLPRPLKVLWQGSHALLLTSMPPFLLAFMAFLVTAEYTSWALESALLVAALPFVRQAFLWPMPWQARLGQVAHIGGSILLLEVVFYFLNLSSESFTPTWGSDLRYSMQYGHMNIWMLLAPACAIVWSRVLLHHIGAPPPVSPVVFPAPLTTAAQLSEPAER